MQNNMQEEATIEYGFGIVFGTKPECQFVSLVFIKSFKKPFTWNCNQSERHVHLVTLQKRVCEAINLD